MVGPVQILEHDQQVRVRCRGGDGIGCRRGSAVPGGGQVVGTSPVSPCVAGEPGRGVGRANGAQNLPPRP